MPDHSQYQIAAAANNREKTNAAKRQELYIKIINGESNFDEKDNNFFQYLIEYENNVSEKLIEQIFNSSKRNDLLDYLMTYPDSQLTRDILKNANLNKALFIYATLKGRLVFGKKQADYFTDLYLSSQEFQDDFYKEILKMSLEESSSIVYFILNSKQTFLLSSSFIDALIKNPDSQLTKDMLKNDNYKFSLFNHALSKNNIDFIKKISLDSSDFFEYMKNTKYSYDNNKYIKILLENNIKHKEKDLIEYARTKANFGDFLNNYSDVIYEYAVNHEKAFKTILSYEILQENKSLLRNILECTLNNSKYEIESIKIIKWIMEDPAYLPFLKEMAENGNLSFIKTVVEAQKAKITIDSEGNKISPIDFLLNNNFQMKYFLDKDIQINGKNILQWHSESGKKVDGLNPIIWCAKAHKLIYNQNPIMWAIENGIRIENKHPIVAALENNIEIDDMHPIIWAIKKDIKLEGMHPAIWAEKNNLTIENKSVFDFCIENLEESEIKDMISQGIAKDNIFNISEPSKKIEESNQNIQISEHIKKILLFFRDLKKKLMDKIESQTLKKSDLIEIFSDPLKSIFEIKGLHFLVWAEKHGKYKIDGKNIIDYCLNENLLSKDQIAAILPDAISENITINGQDAIDFAKDFYQNHPHFYHDTDLKTDEQNKTIPFSTPSTRPHSPRINDIEELRGIGTELSRFVLHGLDSPSTAPTTRGTSPNIKPGDSPRNI